MKILAIGNSFSEDATTYLHQIGEAAGVKNQIVNLYIGGCPLETHWENIESGARKYLFQMNGKKPDYAVSIPQVLEMTDWDVIITQQASHDSGWIESYEPFLGKMLDYIREKQPQARLMLQETWAYASDSVHPKFVRYNHSQKEMFERLPEMSYSTVERVAQLINSIVKYIGENYTSDIKLSTVAKLKSVSPEHLSRTFKAYIGNGFNEYVTLLRLRHAEEMIKNEPDKTISEIAYECGFNDGNYFSYKFKKMYGISPIKARELK